MRLKRSTSIALVVSSLALIALLGLTLATDDASSYSGGITGKTQTGCTCHSPNRSNDVVPKIDGLPSSYEPGKVYDLVLSFTGPSPGPGARAGFNIRVEAGTLSTESPSVRIASGGNEATHSSTGLQDGTWQVKWQAPERDEGDVDVTLVVNMVNGDGSAGQGDKWGRSQVTVGGEGGGISGPVLVAIILLVLVVVGLFIFKRPRSRPKNRPRRKGGKRRDRRK